MLNQLPIGSIVKVGSDSESLMIVAQYPVTTIQDKSGYFDFCAVSLPIGLSDQQLHFFNKEDITELIFIGYIDVNFQTFVHNNEEYEQKLELPKFSIDDLREVYRE